MGANQNEYNKTIAERLEEDHDKNKLGSLYQNKLGKYAMYGSMAPLAGSALHSTLTSQGLGDLGTEALIAGSTLGALAAPLTYRATQKRTIKDTQIENRRNKTIRSGGHLNAAQSADSLLNAGKTVTNAGTAALGINYLGTALTGSSLMSPGALMTGLKFSRGAGNVGAAGYLAANQLAGAHYGNALSGGHVYQNALLGKGISGLGSMLGSDKLAGLGTSIGHMTGMGSMLGMIPYMLATMGGTKLHNMIKSKAEGSTKKYNYRVSDLGRPASSNQAIAKYDTMQSVAGQVNLLTVTNQLSPFETLALGYYQHQSKRLDVLPALFDIFYEKNNKINTKIFHNELSDLLNEHKDTNFSTTGNYISTNKKGKLEQQFDVFADSLNNVKDSFQTFSNKVSGTATILNPLSILTGGLFGNSSYKTIMARFGLDEDTIKEEAIEKTAMDLNIPTAMAQLAETNVSTLMKTSDSIDGKQLAVQAFTANLVQSILQLQLDNRGGFFNKTQSNYDAETDNGTFKKIKDSLNAAVGATPLLNIIPSFIALSKGLKKQKELRDASREAKDVNSFENVDGFETSFIEKQFPQLFLNSIALDVTRNKILESIAKKVGVTTTHKTKSKVYDTITGNITSYNEARKSHIDQYNENAQQINEKYDNAIMEDYRNKNEYEKRRKEDLKILKKESISNAKQTIGQSFGLKSSGIKKVTSVQDDINNKEDIKFKQRVSEGFEALIKLSKEKTKEKVRDIFTNSPSTSTSTSKLKSKSNMFSKGVGLVGGLASSLFGKAMDYKLQGKSLTKAILLSIFNSTRKHPKVAAIAALSGLSYLAYNNSDSVKKGVDKFFGVAKKYFGDTKDFKKPDTSTTAIISAIGGGLLLMPNPYAKVIGGLMMAGVAASNLNIKKIIIDLADKSPMIKEILNFAFPDFLQKSPTRELTRKELLEEKKSNHSATKHDLKALELINTGAGKIKQIDKLQAMYLNKNTSQEKKEELKEFLKKMDINHDGKITNDDYIKNKEMFDKTFKEFKEHNIKTYVEIQKLAFQNKEQMHLTAKQTQEQIAAMVQQQSMLRRMMAELEASKYHITSEDY